MEIRINQISPASNSFYVLKDNRLVLIAHRKVEKEKIRNDVYPFHVELCSPKDGTLFSTYSRKEMISVSEMEEMVIDWFNS